MKCNVKQQRNTHIILLLNDIDNLVFRNCICISCFYCKDNNHSVIYFLICTRIPILVQAGYSSDVHSLMIITLNRKMYLWFLFVLRSKLAVLVFCLWICLQRSLLVMLKRPKCLNLDLLCARKWRCYLAPPQVIFNL